MRSSLPSPSRRLLPALLLAGLLAALLAAPPAPAQAPGDAPPDAAAATAGGEFVDVVDVDVVDVEVIVTDKQGRPILGLTKDDFQVLEDGKPVDLTNFYAVSAGVRVPEGEETGTLPLRGEAPGFMMAPRDQRLNLVVLIDSAHLAPGDRRRTLEDLTDQVGDMLRPGDRVMLAALEPELAIVRPLGHELGPIVEGLGKLGKGAPSSVALEVQRQRVLSQIGRESSAPTQENSATTQITRAELAAGILQQIHSYAAQVDSQNRRTLQAVEKLVASVSGLTGRTAVLYVTGGFNTRPAESLYAYWYQLFQDVANVPEVGFTTPEFEANRWDLEGELSRMVAGASANRVTFYGFNAAGSFSAVASAELGSGVIDADLVRDSSDQDPLLFMAKATGGAASLGSSDPGALLARLEDDYNDYYSLGYVSPKSRDGAEHRIEVRLPGHEFRLRYPKVYEGKSTEQRMAERTMSALLLDATDNPLGVSVKLGRQEKDKGKGWVLPVLVKVPIGKLLLVPQQHSWDGKLSIYLAVQDDQGRVSEPQRVEFPVKVPTARLEEAKGKFFGYGVNLRVRRGQGTIAVGVRDDVAAVSSTVNLRISAGAG